MSLPRRALICSFQVRSRNLWRKTKCLLKKLGMNSRRIQSNIAIEAILDDVWRVLTDYERMAEFLPAVAVSKLVDRKENFARIFQVGQQNLALGLKINPKATLDCYERELQVFDSGRKRDMDFKMIEGEFQVFEGKWSIEQLNRRIAKDDDDDNKSADEGYETTLSYSVDIKPKLWLPVQLIEGRLLKEADTNLSCIRDEAKKLIQIELHSP